MAESDVEVEPLKYHHAPTSRPNEQPVDVEGGGRFDDELFTLRLRYKQPDADTSTKIEFIARQNDAQIEDASSDFQFAAADHRDDPHGYRAEFVDMVRRAQELSRR